MKIKGKTTYQHLGTGFWGVVGDDGQEWRPVDMPSELQKEGLKVELQANKADEQMSVFMWGTAIKIKSYQILN